MSKSFFNISDLNKETLLEIINTPSEYIKNEKLLNNKIFGLIFEKYSTRTRLSFAAGISQLGGNIIEIRFEDLNISRDESFEDTFRAMNCYLDGLIYRTSDHQKLIEASKYFKQPIINALSEQSHPCQTLSDLYTINNYFESLNIHILWMGDMNNVCFSLVEAVNILDELKLTICTPSSISDKVKWKFKGNIEIINDVSNFNLKSVNCVMTDVYISMNDKDSIDKLDSLKPYIVNSDLMMKTNSKSIFMHCLPAKVGMEVTEDVFRSNKSIVWEQAHNRMEAQKKLLKYIYK